MIHLPIQLTDLLKEEDLFTLYAKQALDLAAHPHDGWGVAGVSVPGLGKLWAVYRKPEKVPLFFTWSSDEARAVIIAMACGKDTLEGKVQHLPKFPGG